MKESSLAEMSAQLRARERCFRLARTLRRMGQKFYDPKSSVLCRMTTRELESHAERLFQLLQKRLS